MKMPIKKTVTLILLLLAAACGRPSEPTETGTLEVTEGPARGIPISAPPADNTARTEPLPLVEEEEFPLPEIRKPTGEQSGPLVQGDWGHDLGVYSEVLEEAPIEGPMEVQPKGPYPPIDPEPVHE